MRTLLTAGCLLTALASAPRAQPQPLFGDDIGALAIAIEYGVLRYDLEVDGEARTASYTAPRRGVALVRVTDKRGRELVAVRASQRRTTVRVNGEAVRLRSDQSLYDVEGVDLTAAWLLDQNFAASPSIGLDWLETIAAEANGGEPARSTRGLFDIPGTILDIIGGIVGGGGDKRTPVSSTTCTEEDVNGTSTTVTHQCTHGVAFCTTMRLSVEVPVVVGLADGSTEIRQETREFTRCLCGCLTLVEDR